MLRRNILLGLSIVLTGIVCATALMTATADDIRVANAAMKDDKDAVRSLVKQAVDVNAAQGDGMTALHWAALNNDAELAQMLLYAGANVRATTRIGSYTPLFMAAKGGAAPVIDELLKAGADPKAKGSDGLTPLMMAAMEGNRESVRLLLEHGAEVDAKESEHGQTPLIFAAAFDRPDAIDELAKHGADLNLATIVQAPVQQGRGGGGQGQGQQPVPAAGPVATPAPAAAGGQPSVPAAAGNRGARGQRGAQPAAATAPATAAATAPNAQAAPAVTAAPPANGRRSAATSGAAAPGPAAAPAPGNEQPPKVAGQQPVQQPPVVAAGGGNRGGGNPHGGLTPLMYAARDGHMSAVHALVDSGAKLDFLSADKSTALLLTTINGHFDVAKYLVERGADVSIASVDEATPLYGIVHVQWSRESGRPQPSIKREETNYLDLMNLMLDHGADPNAKLGKTLWYTSYGYAYESTNVAGTTAFWKCAEVGDIDGMKLLLSRGADPTVTNKDGVTALLIASGAGTHGNDDIMAPPGRMTALKYLVEDLHMDVNAAENGAAARGGDFGQMGGGQGVAIPGAAPVAGQPVPPQRAAQQAPPEVFIGGGFTALHNAAARGDNEMILYLVAHGAKVDAVTKSGISVVDQANGPRQRVQPYASTIALLEMLGATNSHKCVSC